MGMDGIELVMKVEGHFGIVIRDDEAVEMSTVGDLVACIQSRIEATTSVPFLSMKCFFSLRRLIRDTTGDTGFRMRPAESVADRLSTSELVLLWKQLAETLGHSRNLRRPKELRAMLLVAGLSTGVIAFAVAAEFNLPSIPLVLLLMAIVAFGLDRSTRSLRTEPPTGWETFGEITKKWAGSLGATKNLELVSEDSVFRELRPIIGDVLGVDDWRISRTSRFVEDLGID